MRAGDKTRGPSWRCAYLARVRNGAYATIRGIEVSQLRWRVAQAAEKRWWRRYLGKRDPAKYLAWKRAYWRTFLGRVGLGTELRGRALDAGCGPAGIFTVLNDCEVVAVDPLLGDYAKLPHFEPAATPNVEFTASTLETFTAQQPFDYVFCLNVINHVRDLDGALQVLAKALKPGGTFVLSVDAHRHAWLKPIFRAIPGDVLHPHQLDLADYESACARIGLTVESKLLYKKEFLFDYWVLTLRKRPWHD